MNGVNVFVAAFVGLALFGLGVMAGAKIVDEQHKLRKEVNRQIYCNKKELT